jgi:hypothetical protein
MYIFFLIDLYYNIMNSLTNYSDNNVKILQRTIKQLYCIRNIRRFRRCFIDLYKLCNNKLNKNDPQYMNKLGCNYDKLIKLMRNKTVIKIFTALSNILYTKPNRDDIKLDGKELIMIFAFYGYPEFTLEIVHDTNNKVYLTAKKIVQIWIKILNQQNQIANINILIDYLNLFSYYYKIHMFNDKAIKINQLLMRWYTEEREKENTNNDDNIDKDRKKLVLDMLNTNQQSTIKIIKRFYKDFDEEILVEYKNMVDNIETTVHKAFWNRIEDDFRNNNYKSFTNILSEIKIEILKLTSNKLLQELDEKFDIEFIEQMLYNSAYDKQDFENLCNYLVSIIETLQAQVRTPVMRKEWNELCSTNNNQELSTFIDYMKFIFNEIKLIKENISTLKILDSIGINPFTI